MTLDIENQIIEYGKLAGVKDLTPGISGNISAKNNDRIIITASGSANGYLAKEDLSIIDFSGKVISGNQKPSSEKGLHIEIYKKRPDINCIFHVHSPYLTAFASAGIALDEAILPEIIFCFDKIPLANYALPGSADLVKNTSYHHIFLYKIRRYHLHAYHHY